MLPRRAIFASPRIPFWLHHHDAYQGARFRVIEHAAAQPTLARPHATAHLPTTITRFHVTRLRFAALHHHIRQNFRHLGTTAHCWTSRLCGWMRFSTVDEFLKCDFKDIIYFHAHTSGGVSGRRMLLRRCRDASRLRQFSS